MHGEFGRTLAAIVKAEKERSTPVRRRDVSRAPLPFFKEQVLALAEPEQGDCNELPLLVTADEDRIFALHLFEFARDDEGLIHIVEFGRSARRNAQ